MSRFISIMSSQKLEKLQIFVEVCEIGRLWDHYELIEPELLDQELSDVRFCALREVRITLKGHYYASSALADGLRERMPRLSASDSVMFFIDEQGNL